jgi:hypothetical protein
MLDNRAQNQTTDTAKTVNRDANCHGTKLLI